MEDCLKVLGLNMFDFAELSWTYEKSYEGNIVTSKPVFTQPVIDWLRENNIDLHIDFYKDSRYLCISGKASDLIFFKMRWLQPK